VIEIPLRKIVSLDANMVAMLECGHQSWGVEYADHDVPCVPCTRKCEDKIGDIRGRAAVKCQQGMRENVWDWVGGHFGRTTAEEVRYLVSNEIEGGGIPF